MKLLESRKRLRPWHAVVLAPASAVVGVWAFMLVAPSLPEAILVPLATGSSPETAKRADEPREPTEAELKAAEWAQAYQQQNWSRCIELGLELDSLAPGNRSYQYNLACAYALNAEPEKAVAWLTRAAASGFLIIKLFENDPDLESVRSHAGYEAALSIVKKNRADDLANLRARFEENPIMVVMPPEYEEDEPAPLIIALHGKGSRASNIVREWRDMAAEIGAILVVPEAVYPFPGSAGFTWMGADTLSSLCDDAEFLVRLAFEFAVKEYLIDRNRVILTGFSEGGFVSQSVAIRPPYIFTGVIPMGSGYLRGHDAPPKATGDRLPRFYFMCGERDGPADQIPVAAQDYRAAGYEATYRVYPEVGHRFPIERDEELRKALDFVLQR